MEWRCSNLSPGEKNELEHKIPTRLFEEFHFMNEICTIFFPKKLFKKIKNIIYSTNIGGLENSQKFDSLISPTHNSNTTVLL